MKRRLIAGAAAGVDAISAALWWRKHPSACPYGQRFWVQPPHPLITRARLREMLAPAAGERVLEVGPATGYYSLHMSDWICPGGQLDISDPQQPMLDHTMREAAMPGRAASCRRRAMRVSCPGARVPSGSCSGARADHAWPAARCGC